MTLRVTAVPTFVSLILTLSLSAVVHARQDDSSAANVDPSPARQTPQAAAPRGNPAVDEPALIRFNFKGATLDQVIDFFLARPGCR